MPFDDNAKPRVATEKKRNQIPHTKTLKPKSACTMLHIIKEIYLKEIKVVRCLRALKL